MVKEGFKQTEIGVIPEDWKVYKIADLTPKNIKYTIVDGPFGSNLKTIHYRKKGIPIITSGYVTDGKFSADSYFYVDKEKFIQEKRSSVQAGDIVMAKIGERCGACAILPYTHQEGILSGNALKIKIDDNKFDATLINQILYNHYLTGKLSELRTVGAQPAISMANLKIYKIPLPPLPEQKAISEALSDADAWIENLEQCIAKKRLIKQGAMQDLLTPKEDWEVKKLGELAIVHTGKKNNQDKIENGDYPFFVRSQNVERINSYSFEGEAILIPGEGNLGSIVHYISGKFDFHQRVYKISNWNGLNGKYLYWYFRMYFGNHAMQNTVKATVDSIRLPTLQEFKLAFPSINEQTRIATILSDMDNELESLENKLEKARQIKQGMMQELLTGRVRLVS